MSIQSEINRLKQAKQNLKTSINSKGGNLTSENISAYYKAVDSLSAKPKLEQTTVTPSSSTKIVTPSNGYDGLSKVTINGDLNLKPENIKEGVQIFGVAGNLAGGIIPRIVNDQNIVPTGSYANKGLYDKDYGIKVGYMRNGDILLSIKSTDGESDYEKADFRPRSLPSGVSIYSARIMSESGGQGGMIYACLIKGVIKNMKLEIEMDKVSSAVDCFQCNITMTEV